MLSGDEHDGYEEGRQFWNRTATFDKDRLPQWGGKTGSILEQPKCWSSLNSLKEYHKEELRKPEKVIRFKTRANVQTNQPTFHVATRVAASSFRRLYTVPKKSILHNLFSTSKTSNDEVPSTDAVVGVVDPNKPHSVPRSHPTKQRIPVNTHTNIPQEDVKGNKMTQRRVGRMAKAEQRVLAQISQLQSSPVDRIAFLRQVETRKRQRLEKWSGIHSTDSKKGALKVTAHRNMILENIWLNDSKNDCITYWEQTAKLQNEIALESSPQKQLELYKTWPHPPTSNRTRKSLEKKRRLLTIRRKVQRDAVVKRRSALVKMNEQKLVQLEYSFMCQQQKAEKAVAASKTFSVILMVVACLKCHKNIEFARSEKLRLRKSTQSAIVIQRSWKRTKASVHGRKFRTAIRCVRRFFTTAMLTRRVEQKHKSAEIILWFLAQENSDFIKVMRNYRYLVIQAQRYWRSFCAISKARVRVASMMWEQLEKDQLASEKQILAQESKTLANTVREDLRGIFEAVRVTAIADRHASRESRREGRTISGASSNVNRTVNLIGTGESARRIRRMTSAMASMQLDFIADGVKSKKSMHSKVNFATLCANVDGAPKNNVSCKFTQALNRVPKQLRVAAISQHLKQERTKFRAKYQVGGHARKLYGGDVFPTLGVDEARSLLLQGNRPVLNDKASGVNHQEDATPVDLPKGLIFFTTLTQETLYRMIQLARKDTMEQSQKMENSKTFLTSATTTTQQ